MSSKLYNLIMHSDPAFWSGDNGYVDFPKERFLEHTEDQLKNQFQPLDQSAINKLKALPTLFAAEHECTDTRIGKITNLEVKPKYLRIYYKFSEECYPLTKGVLQKNWQKLDINQPNYEFYRTHWAVKECDIPDFYEGYLKTLTGIAHQLKGSNKKVQLIYAFNGSGKTRLSREFKKLISPKFDDIENVDEVEDFDEIGQTRNKILYYNAFTEDLFYWDNDLEGDAEHKLIIQHNSFTDWILKDQGQDQKIITNFQHYTNDKLTPQFNPEYKTKDKDGKEITIPAFSEVTFSLERGDDDRLGNLKISKAEESNFIWSIFYTLLKQVVEILNDPEEDVNEFKQLEYVFIDDPVSSLDDNHLIELAVNLSDLIKSAPASLKFIITTHSPLFYNVLYNELNKKTCYLLENFEDGTFSLNQTDGDSNKSFSYHLYIKQILEKAVVDNQIEKYHFTLLRNLYEKTCGFLGYEKWTDLLPDDEETKKAYLKRIIQFTSHNTLANEAVADPTPEEKKIVGFLLRHLHEKYSYWPKQGEQHA